MGRWMDGRPRNIMPLAIVAASAKAQIIFLYNKTKYNLSVLEISFLLLQDNTKPHVARVCQQFLEDKGNNAIEKSNLTFIMLT